MNKYIKQCRDIGGRETGKLSWDTESWAINFLEMEVQFQGGDVMDMYTGWGVGPMTLLFLWGGPTAVYFGTDRVTWFWTKRAAKAYCEVRLRLEMAT